MLTKEKSQKRKIFIIIKQMTKFSSSLGKSIHLVDVNQPLSQARVFFHNGFMDRVELIKVVEATRGLSYTASSHQDSFGYSTAEELCCWQHRWTSLSKGVRQSPQGRLIIFDHLYYRRARVYSTAHSGHWLCPKFCVNSPSLDLHNSLFIIILVHTGFFMAKELILQNIKCNNSLLPM